MQINKKVFNLETVLNTLTYGKVMENYYSFLEIEKELQEQEIELLNVSEDFEEAMAAVNEIEEQLDYLSRNITVFRDALLVLESEAFQRITLDNIQYKICLN
jgi:hypothetical protein